MMVGQLDAVWVWVWAEAFQACPVGPEPVGFHTDGMARDLSGWDLMVWEACDYNTSFHAEHAPSQVGMYLGVQGTRATLSSIRCYSDILEVNAAAVRQNTRELR